MAELILREMKAEDLEAVSALEAENFSHPWRYEDFRDALSKEHYLYHVAELIISPARATVSPSSSAT